jgi:hypothetical protein
MPGIFDFSLDEDLALNTARLKAHLETLDQECAKILFDNFSVLDAGDNGRREFNGKVLAALQAAAQEEIKAGTRK